MLVKLKLMNARLSIEGQATADFQNFLAESHFITRIKIKLFHILLNNLSFFY
jgi:hypothetical protein